jgi:hypothetical protein
MAPTLSGVDLENADCAIQFDFANGEVHDDGNLPVFECLLTVRGQLCKPSAIYEPERGHTGPRLHEKRYFRVRRSEWLCARKEVGR